MDRTSSQLLTEHDGGIPSSLPDFFGEELSGLAPSISHLAENHLLFTLEWFAPDQTSDYAKPYFDGMREYLGWTGGQFDSKLTVCQIKDIKKIIGADNRKAGERAIKRAITKFGAAERIPMLWAPVRGQAVLPQPIGFSAFDKIMSGEFKKFTSREIYYLDVVMRGCCKGAPEYFQRDASANWVGLAAHLNGILSDYVSFTEPVYKVTHSGEDIINFEVSVADPMFKIKEGITEEKIRERVLRELESRFQMASFDPDMIDSEWPYRNVDVLPFRWRLEDIKSNYLGIQNACRKCQERAKLAGVSVKQCVHWNLRFPSSEAKIRQ